MSGCAAVHKLMNARCLHLDEGEAHKDMGHKAKFEGVDYHWRPTAEEWARWGRAARAIRWPEYDSDPTRRMSATEFDRALFVRRLKYPELKVVVATGSPETPWANIMALNEVTLPDGTVALVLEL